MFSVHAFMFLAADFLSQNDELYNRLMEQADDMHLVRLQTPWRLNLCRDLPLNEQGFSQTKNEWMLSALSSDCLRSECKLSRTYNLSACRPPEEWKG